MRKEQIFRRDNIATALIPAAPLLITESAKDFAEMHDALHQEIRPHGIIEKMYVADIAHFNWEILRLWRCRSTIVNVAYKSAIKEILRMLCMRNSEIYNDADDLSLRWFTDEDARGEVLDVLRGFHLDKSAIEAQAMAQSAVDLDLLDRLLASLQARRDRTLRCIAEYRGSLANQLRASSNRIIDGKITPLKEVCDTRSRRHGASR